MSCYSRNVCICFVAFIALSIHQLSVQTHDVSAQTILAPEEIPINAKSAVLMDAATGDILLEHNAHKRTAPASFAKLMTLYVVFDIMRHQKIHLEDEVFVSEKAWQTQGSKMFIEVNSKVSIEELIKGITIVSGNDACVAIAEHLYGDTDTFASVMNKYAQKLNMKDTQFSNPHGLPNGEQFTTAHDMALLARNYVIDFPEAIQFHSMQEYTYADIKQNNRNGLLRKDASVDGLKTGWVEEGGYHLLATAIRDNQRLIAVVMGAESPSIRETEALKLLNYGYQNFSLLSFFSAGQVFAEIPVWKGRSNTLPIVVQHSSMVVVPRESESQVKKVGMLPEDVVAPVDKDQVLGELAIQIDSETIKSFPLIAGESIEKAGLLKSFSHQLYLFGRSHKKRVFIVTGSMVSLCVVAMLVLLGKKRRRKPGFRF